MGKGSGGCTQRPSMTFESLVDQASPSLTKEEILEALKDSKGPERVLLLEELKVLNTSEKHRTEIEWKNNKLSDVKKLAVKYKGQDLAPLFYENSMLKDNVAYLEYAKRKIFSNNEYASVKFVITDEDLEDDDPNVAGLLSILQSKGENYVLPFKNKQEGVVGGFFDKDLEFIITHSKSLNTIWKKLSKQEQKDFLALLDKKKDAHPLKDWVTPSVPEWTFLADITSSDEAPVIEFLVAEGATIEENTVDLPNYQSVHSIEGGKKFYLAGEGYRIDYVPHHSLGTKQVNIQKYKLEWSPSQEQVQEIRDKTTDFFSNSRAQPVEEILVHSIFDKEGKLVGEEKIKPIAILPKEHKEAILKAVEDDEPILLKEQANAWRKATMEELEKCPVYSQLDNGNWIYKRHKKQMDDQLKAVAEIEKASQENKKYTWDWSQYSDEPAQPKYHEKPKTVEEQLEMESFTQLEKLIRKTSRENGWPYGTVRLMTNDDGSLRETISSDIKAETTFEHIPHKAPTSERGQLRVICAEPEKAIAKLQEYKITGDTQTKVPWNLLYPNNGTGKFSARHDDYLSGQAEVKLPKGKKIYHGLTGISTTKDATDRLESIIKTGGLKSIAERRRLAIKVMSMSPIGDIASGIDMGVPCTINAGAHYGSCFTFQLKDECFSRRDVFFANQDYGGGTNRFESYNSYAKGLGQKGMYDPPNAKSREKHLSTGLGGSNEMYFHGEVPLNDMEAIIAHNPEAYNAAVALVKKYKKLIPEGLKIVQK